ncbi:redoxin family protein [Granulosicoccus antarcticus]|uniref:Methylamine utilization protein MauD n=1 Tax=Granulosicoccus antarcticus IMCC3135 TaxID=1192854 RepID=A0A2Z2NYT8_9GAMM|nr:redoxin family protein [Granulosicoccus antarcticus]ASJ74020.1 Methylamine utilization protein MauD [Granulosicoccus antarcticus IMCC3135]
MSLLLISNLFLWIVVLVMAFVIYALTRQIGVLYERVAPAGALAVNQNIEVGQIAPAMSLQTLTSQMVQIGDSKKSGKSQLIFWLSPDCPICKTLVPALKTAAKAESDWVDLVLASDGMELDHKSYVNRFGLERFPYVISELLGKRYGVAKLPYAVLIDEQGKVASMGIINSREHLDSLFEAKERKVGSIQDYLSKKNAEPKMTDLAEVE